MPTLHAVCGVLLLMNLHDFVTESFNLEHIFRDAHTVPFCLTADHIATCHMSLSLPASSQHSFGLPLDTCCMESVRYL